MFGLFSKKDNKAVSGTRQLTKDYASVLKILKRDRVNYCQTNGMSLSEMGKDLAHIERKAKSYYSATIAHLKNGLTQDEAYREHLSTANTETDKMILEKLFIKKTEK